MLVLLKKWRIAFPSSFLPTNASAEALPSSHFPQKWQCLPSSIAPTRPHLLVISTLSPHSDLQS
ncbi:hypothetical protein BJX65DRAFT_276891 [Aspergillus insuetus]